MSRPLRIEFHGAIYHVTSRGDRKLDIYRDDSDRRKFLEILADVVDRYHWVCHAYCLMGNHYHLIIETPDGNLSQGMRQLNGVFTQATNQRHKRVGHMFQGRYKAILVDKQSYLLEVSRYVVLNPVRAGWVTHPEQWAWSSYVAMVDPGFNHPWLTTSWLLGQFSEESDRARSKYAQFVLSGISQPSIWENLNQQIYLGDDAFVEQVQFGAENTALPLDVPIVQKRSPAAPLKDIAHQHASRDAGIVAAYATGAYSYHDIADHYELHYTSIGKIVRRARANQPRGQI